MNTFLIPIWIMLIIVGGMISMYTLLLGLYYIGIDNKKNKRNMLGKYLYIENRLKEILAGFGCMYFGMLGLIYVCRLLYWGCSL